MAYPASYSPTSQDPYPKIVDIGSRRTASEESRPVYDDGFVGPSTEGVAVSASVGVTADGEPIDARIIVRSCGAVAAAVYAVLDATDRSGQPTTYLDLEETFSLSRRQVRYLVAFLVEHGFARVEKGGGRGKESVITPVTAPSNSAINSAKNNAMDCTESAQTVQETVHKTVHKTVQLGGPIGGNSLTATENESVVDEKGGAGGKRKQARSTATTIPDDFTVTAEMMEWAIDEEGMTRKEVDRETAKFLDHFDGSGAKKVKWVATWRNWMRNRTKYEPKRSTFKSQADINSPAPGKFVS